MTGRSLLMFGTGLISFLLGYLSDPLLCSSLHDVFFLPPLKFIHVNWLYLLHYYASLNMSFLYYLCLDSIPSIPSCDALLSCCYCTFEPLDPDLVPLHLLELTPNAGWNHPHARWNKGLWRTKMNLGEAGYRLSRDPSHQWKGGERQLTWVSTCEFNSWVKYQLAVQCTLL